MDTDEGLTKEQQARMAILDSMVKAAIDLTGRMADKVLGIDRGFTGTAADDLAKTKALTQLTIMLGAAVKIVGDNPATLDFYIDRLAEAHASAEAVRRRVAEIARGAPTP